MPMNGYGLGRDVAVDFNLPQGPVRFSIITDFSAKQNTKRVESHGIDGICRYQEIPAGWEGSIEVDRADSNIDTAIGFLEQLYYAGANVPASTLTETISEPNGTVTQWRFIGVMFKFDDHGSWKGDNKVTQKLGWVASVRVQVQ
jgi:hypothetical protein